MTDERIVALDLVRHSGLNAIAQECHRLAVARGKFYEGWDLYGGYCDIFDELEEWLQAHWNHEPQSAVESEFGDILHAMLSVGQRMGYDLEQLLRDAMQRNAERGKEGV